MNRDLLLKRAAAAKRESKTVALRKAVDIDSAEFRCALVRDAVALANSGGGVVAFLEGAGEAPSPSMLRGWIKDHTGTDFRGVAAAAMPGTGGERTALLISPADAPLVFAKAGIYNDDDGAEQTAFVAGTVYFRHRGRSEPATNADLSAWRDRALATARKEWSAGISKVIRAPAGSTISVVSPDVADIHLADVAAGEVAAKKGAMSVVPRNAEEIWPYRRSELLQRVNATLGGVPLNAHDIQCINWKLGVLQRPDFAYRPHHQASVQYSPAYADWIVTQMRANPTFLRRAREGYQAELQRRRQAERKRLARRFTARSPRDHRPTH
jgi:hypothetical protein